MENAKIVLLNPPGTITKNAKLVIHHGIPHLGLAYIAGALKKQGMEFKLIDAIGEDINRFRSYRKNKNLLIRGLSFQEVLARFPKNPRYLCIASSYATDWLHTSELIKKLKQLYPKSIVILGGENATSYWDKILKYEDTVDFCVSGEGDEIIINLINTLEKGQSPRSLEGIIFRDGSGEIVKNPKPTRIKDLSDLKPDWDQFPLDNYFKNRTAVRSYGKKTMPMIASRGCPYQCTFCNSPNKWGTTQVVRSPEEVIEEMRLYRDKYKIDHICLVDLASTVNGKWFLDLCHQLIAADLGITWEMSSGTRSELLSYENLIIVKKSGNIHLSLSPESGSEKTLKDIKKFVDLKHFEQVVKDCSRVGIRVKTNFITGLDSQSIEEINLTYLLALKYAFLGADDVVIYSYVPYPGTEMHNQLLSTGGLSINNREEYERYNIQLSEYSFVGPKKSDVRKDYPIHILNLVVMLLAYCIALVRKPIRIPELFWKVALKKPIGVFEVALYAIIKYPFLIMKMRRLDKNEKEDLFSLSNGKEVRAAS
jgi:anaerobic magnesium-protoporphyrin IX monomethyl ester cyclase